MTVERSPVPALDRGLAVLELIGGQENGIGFGEIARRLHIPTASLARLLQALRMRGYVCKEMGEDVWRLGPQASLLGKGLSHAEHLARLALPVVRNLRDATANTALFIHGNGNHLQCLAKEMHERSIVMQDVGEIRTDLFAYPWSPLVWAVLPEDKRVSLLKLYPPETEQRLIAGLSAWDTVGWLIWDDGDLVRLTAPVMDGDNQFVGAVGLGGTRQTLPVNLRNTAGESVARAARNLSENLGWTETHGDKL